MFWSSEMLSILLGDVNIIRNACTFLYIIVFQKIYFSLPGEDHM